MFFNDSPRAEGIELYSRGLDYVGLNRLVRFIDQFKSMNFANDTIMDQQLESLKKELLTRTAEEYRDSAVARARLKQGLSQLANQGDDTNAKGSSNSWTSDEVYSL